MQVYLLKDVPGKGKAGEVITVNDGYGRNFLVKQGMARVADSGVLSSVKAKADSQSFHKEQEIQAIKDVIKRLETAVVALSVKKGANGKVFGSITGEQIAAGLKALGFDIDKKNLVFDTIKDVGEYKIKVKFNHGLSGGFIVNAN